MKMLKDIKILLVEDNPGDARLIQEMLIEGTKKRVTVELVNTLADAITNKHNEYDIFLLDLSLPDSHGLRTLTKLQSEVADKPIVVLTGIDDEMVGIEAVQMGAQDYIPKGDLDSRLLARSIRYAIQRNQAEVALRKSEEEYRSLIDDVFDTSMVAVLILDKNFNVVWCNEATKIYFGINRERLIGKDKRRLIDDDLKCIFADPDDYAAQLLKAYDEGSFTERFECRILPTNELQERWLVHWSQPIRAGIYEGGRVEQYTDITDRKILEVAEREQREFAEALGEISTLLTSNLELNGVLNLILSNLGRVVPHDSASITLVDDEHFQITEHQRNNEQEQITERRMQLDYRSYADKMYKSGQPIIIEDLQLETHMQSIATDASIHAYVGTPIHLQDNIIGFINLISEEVGFFTNQHSERLVAFSKLAAIAIQNARLFDESRQLAGLEERQRLARELHDSVSQTLFTCRTMSESALHRWKRDPNRAYELLNDVNKLTATALAEMRILLLELRPTALTRVGIKQLFEQYLQPIQGRHEFQLVLSIDDIPPLPPNIQIALYRITQEAMNNIDKHSQTNHVEVRATNTPDSVIIEIRDQGVGFIPTEVAPTSLGLGIMRERAYEIGASIEIVSEIGQGTQITIIWEKDKIG